MSEAGGISETPPSRSFWRSAKMIAWAFFGIRKANESQEDLARVSPLHIVAAGIGGAAIFVFGLIALVQWVVAR